MTPEMFVVLIRSPRQNEIRGVKESFLPRVGISQAIIPRKGLVPSLDGAGSDFRALWLAWRLLPSSVDWEGSFCRKVRRSREERQANRQMGSGAV